MPEKTLFEKILWEHGIQKAPEPGSPLAIPIDQTLTQDATGTMAYLQFEALGIPRVRTELSVSYVDHNMAQASFHNFDDHRYLQTVAAAKGVVFSGPGSGISHQIHLERFGIPGKTLLGSDSHTCTGGGIGMLAMGAGGLDVAMAMAGEPFTLTTPRVVAVVLEGELPPWVAAKDVILEVLGRLTVKGGVGKVIEYTGPGVKTLSVPERATITNMGAELGATSSIFPSDENTRAFMAAQGRVEDFTPLEPDPGATYHETITIDLGGLVPLVARPHMPDQVVPVSDIAGQNLDQVVIGSCTNSSYKDLATVAAMLKGRTIDPETSLVIAPGSRQVLAMLADSGELTDMIRAGARILECACGPCIGIGQAPPSQGVTLRTVNRNFQGRSGTPDAEIYISSPETAAASALAGKFTDPRSLGNPVKITWPDTFPDHNAMILYAPDACEDILIRRGPNIKPLPKGQPIGDKIEGQVLITLGDNITTDDIMPGGTHIMSFRSNIPAIAQYVFSRKDPNFAQRALDAGGGFIVAGENYGQGSSREHAALSPMYLGIRAVLARSFARIHRANLINFGILPLILEDPDAMEAIRTGDILGLSGAAQAVAEKDAFQVKKLTQGKTLGVRIDLNDEERHVAIAGGRLNWYGKTHRDSGPECRI